MVAKREMFFVLGWVFSCFAAMILGPMKWMMSIGGWLVFWSLRMREIVCFMMEGGKKMRRLRFWMSELGVVPVFSVR